MTMRAVTVDLPLPTSTNSLYRRAGRRVVKSGEYKAWIKEAGLRLNTQHPASIKGPVTITITVGGRVDIDNRVKSILDLLRAHGVIENDSPKFVRECSVRHSSSIQGCRVTITPVAEARAA